MAMNFATHVDRAARNAPRSLAVGDPTRSLTFEELAEQSDRIAYALDRRGVKADDHVAINIQNGIAFVATYLGVLKRGAVAVPVNTEYTHQQIQYVLADSDAACVITDGRDAAFGISGLEIYRYIVLRDGEGRDKTAPRRSDEMAELLYTSGTTGAPKGVYHTHGNLAANATGYIEYNEWDRDDVALTVCPCFHVTGLNITTTPFIALEAENHLLEAWNIEAALAAIEEYDVTYTFLIPTMVVELLDYERIEDYDVSSLEIVGVGGSPMPKERIDDIERALECTLVEGYGMTETTPLAALNRPVPSGRKAGSIGRPVREAIDVRVEDTQTEEAVERGMRGELLWRGDTVTPGYNKRQTTESNFVERGGERWLKSGDIGWMDEDGFLFVVDRIEDMFTTGCGDISPREVEEVIYEIDPVQKAAIIDVRDDVRGATVTAIVRRRSEGSLSAAEVKHACEQALRDHEVPEQIVFTDDIPVTATGKIDRATLRDRFG
jgi:long-chain acyl-CoA synthetase